MTFLQIISAFARQEPNIVCTVGEIETYQRETIFGGLATVTLGLGLDTYAAFSTFWNRLVLDHNDRSQQ